MLTDSGPPPQPSHKSPLRNPLFYSVAALVIVGLYVCGILLYRWQENRQIEGRAAQAHVEKQREQDRIAIEQLGGKDLAIQMFYASPAVVHPGQTVQLCYGVANAKNVKLEPQDNPVWPSPNRCVDVAPRKTTTYTLAIDDGAGHSQTQSLTVKVE